MSSPELATPMPVVLSPPQMEFISPPQNVEEYLDVDHDDVELRYRNIYNILSAATPPDHAARQVVAALHLHIEDEPSTFVEAKRYQPGQHTMLEEINFIEKNHMWHLVPLPPGHQPIGLKWVFKLKKNAASEVIKHKAWLVAKDYIQQ
jgi:hypothetical protein